MCEAGMRKTYMHISLHLYLYPYLYLYLLMCLYLYYVWHTHRTPTAHTRTHIVREIAKGRCHACLCMRMFIIMCASLASPRAVELVGEHCSASSCSPHPLFEGERVMMLGLGSCPFRSALQMTSYEELLPVRTPLAGVFALKLNKHVGPTR